MASSRYCERVFPRAAPHTWIPSGAQRIFGGHIKSIEDEVKFPSASNGKDTECGGRLTARRPRRGMTGATRRKPAVLKLKKGIVESAIDVVPIPDFESPLHDS